MTPIQKVLVANRGEIAVRVMRTCRELGIRTVAVYSEPDQAAMHVRFADEAYCVGPAPSAQSYLRMQRILDVALMTGTDAIHPGYGFLSENAEFAEACQEAGVRFIGPPPAAIRAMGDKTAARALMEKAGVPMAPGTVDAVSDSEQALEIARDIGFPVLIKAAAGGGGKGMRIVHEEGDFVRSMDAAAREATSAFGDGRVFIEKFIQEPKHIEFQVLADMHGTCLHLFERECTIQRRHQKVVEEAPAAGMRPELREAMAQAAVSAARSCGYVGAGTVEFLLDTDGSFYFMEMNTRLQVEHPVTEWITGTDLVAEQIRIAEGRALSLKQEDLQIHGHAVECRVYAENPATGFLPDPGRLKVHRPASGPGVRVDAGVEEGDEVQIHYDPMISKLTAWAPTRREAIARMVRAIDEYEVAGVETTLPFCRFVMQHEAFASGAFSTRFVERHFDPELISPTGDAELLAAFAAHQAKASGRADPVTATAANGHRSEWARRRRD
ncbi:MAG: acetyl-CoA carboxylase biotin carboxylase subunit [Rhodothermales bacterium]|nr:acetyl-CoA carboxylase biotin carboxylase subunit [Rhodothermales bacterium]MBO6778765.1 acetyl-CoA carboxylase biotin carboxylase subunit [Rhodothermales bacterium]